MTPFLVGAGITWVVLCTAGFARAIHNAPVIDEPVRYVQAEDILITPHGVEIPLSWVACEADVDEILATLHEIDQLGTGATA